MGNLLQRLAAPWTSVVLLGCIVLCGQLAAAAAPRVLPQGQLPEDRRLGPLKTLDDYFPFQPQPGVEAWQKRAEDLRRQMRVALGLWPMPTKTPNNAMVHGKIDRGDYTVEKVYLESFPGHFVTGNLYRPKNRMGRLPGVLCPHGHWRDGRFYDAGSKALEEQLRTGAEKHDPCGRYPLQARCVQLARMGCVVFHYDMVGYADSVQLDHRPGLREHMCTPERWGYFSPQAELRMQNMMGLQTYNSIRALDWLAELPDVDPGRIAVTGASGGGTQTFILCAIDPRPAVAFPAVMVSTAMQGGCTCENACYLRIGTGNVEIAALIAPRPLGMTAADDWTKEMPTKGFPELQQHYAMLKAADRVALAPFLQYGHNYNYLSRQAMYGWMNRHLSLGFAEPIEERPFEPLSRDEMTVWNDDHLKPPGGDDYERSLLRWITEDSEQQIRAIIPRDAKSLQRFREVVGGAWQVLIGRSLPHPAAVTLKPAGKQAAEGYVAIKGLVCYEKASEQVPAIALVPEQQQWNGELAIWLHPLGKQALFLPDGTPKPEIGKLLRGGMGVVGVDLFGQGEFTEDGRPISKNRLDPKRTGYAGYTYGYNHPLFAQRVHDVLSVIAAATHEPNAVRKIHLVGLDGAGPWAAAAAMIAGDAVDCVAVDTGGFRFAQLTALDDADFLPGAVKYLDLPGVLALCVPRTMWLAGEGNQAPAVVAAAYEAARAQERLNVCDQTDPEMIRQAAAEWLLGRTASGSP